MTKDIYILGIESSCDDTSAAVLKNGVLLSNVTASQAVHESYGGVVPELASRAHQWYPERAVVGCRFYAWSRSDGFAVGRCELCQGLCSFVGYSPD